MELVIIIFMLVAGGAIAVFVMTFVSAALREGEAPDAMPPHREAMAASLLFQVVSAGGVGRDEALRQIRRSAGLAAPVTAGIDILNWAESYARLADSAQRRTLLETAVRLVAGRDQPVPLRQYAALLDLSFGLGFQTDALAKLRSAYGFEYVDHARAERSRGVAATFVRSNSTPAELLALLGISGKPTRQQISAAYRRLVAQHHPDRFHHAPAAEKSEAAERFIEITRAYEELLQIYRD